MKRVATALAVAAISAPASADLTGFVQMRQAQRVHSSATCRAIAGCRTMVQEVLGELLYERRFTDRLGGTARVEGYYDKAISRGRVVLREGFIDWSPTPAVGFRVGRQILTWGVSNYLYVNDVFPKNYDAFFTGGGFERMKEPVDAAHMAVQAGSVNVEAVVSKSRADKTPDSNRFTAMAMTTSALEADDDERTDVSAKVSTYAGGWDVAAYAASFGTREERFFIEGANLHSERPRTRHLGLSVTGNFAGGVLWVEGAVRRISEMRTSVVSRHFLGSVTKLIGGYSRQIGQDTDVSIQLQLEAPTSYTRYVDSLAPDIRPLKRVSSTLHLSVQSRWVNQTLRAGAQLFAGNEGDTHLNPFVSWSPADGWTIEGGANLFDGKSYTRYGAFKDDSNVYVLGRFSF